MFRTSILPSKVLGEAPMMVANFPLVDDVEIYDKKGNPDVGALLNDYVPILQEREKN